MPQASRNEGKIFFAQLSIMNKNCRVCRSHGNHARYIVEEMMFGYRDRFEYFQCSSCKCLQIADIPGDMEKYYPPQYYSFTPKKRRFLGNPVDTLFRRIQNRFTIFPGGLFGRMVSTWAPNKKLSSLGNPDLSGCTISIRRRIRHQGPGNPL